MDVNATTGNYAAPSQLKCSSRQYPDSGPFLESPFTGWASINSFLDHDSPDYSQDGEIVLANGLHAYASNGQDSDVFPAYWSSALRQYINYDGHNGYDYGISYQPVQAAADGTVMFAGWNGPSEYSGYGQMVLIDHHNGYVTLYGHLSSLELRKGDKVTAGEEIGISGSTGNSSGPHLHFSVFHNCQVTDPYGWIGSGKDPLVKFEGEHASYLWLPGNDPLVLNSPPNWPTYPLGLRVALPPGVAAGRLSLRAIPPVDRLLLLSLPGLSGRARVSPGLALARTEALIDQEALELTPYLDSLESQGLVDSYRVVPAAAAIWVRGNAPSQKLERLPGVASLSGVRPADLQAGQTGLAHSVLIQLGPQQAPSLWPVGFRSALHPWRPVITAVNRHALVEGFALPGEHVIVSVQRNGTIPGAAQATGDAQTGGFVAMLQDETGQPLAVRSGDIVVVQTGGRVAAVRVSALRVRVHARSVSGRTRPGATVPISIVSRGSDRLWHAVATADNQGHFALAVPSALPSGSLAVASITDAAGDQESASSHVPGVIVDTSSGSITGWAVNRTADMEVWRSGRQILVQPVDPSEDGIYQLSLRQSRAAYTLRPGDILSVGSRWHRHRLVIPHLAVRLTLGSRDAALSGPADAVLKVDLTHGMVQTAGKTVLDGEGHATVKMAAPIGIGDAAALSFSSPSGDLLLASARVRGVEIHVGSATVIGQTLGGTRVTVRLLSASGARLGAATAESDFSTGSFSARLRTRSGRTVQMSPGMKVVIHDPGGSLKVTVPRLDLTRGSSSDSIVIRVDARRATLTTVDRNNHRLSRSVAVGSAGEARTRIPSAETLKSVSVATFPANGVSFLRKLDIGARTPGCATGNWTHAACTSARKIGKR